MGEKEKKEIFIETPMVETDELLFEQIQKEDGKTCYLASDYQEYDEVDNKKPIEDPKALEDGVVLLPDGIKDYGTTQKLLEEIKAHIHKWLDISPEYEEFASYYILLSWLYDKTTTLCYLRALGDFSTGKSRFLDVIGRICYRPLIIAGALTSAVVYRALDKWRGTLVIDEGDFKRSDESQDIIKILNVGFEKNRASVIRVNKDNISKIDTFNVYGTKVISSRKPFNDPALESRCLTEKMMSTRRKDILPILTKDFYMTEKDLRRKLLKYRFDNYFKVDFEYQPLILEHISMRLKQATNSFSILFHNDSYLLQRFQDFIEKYNRELIEEKQQSFDGLIIQTIANSIMNNRLEITSSDICTVMKNEHGYDKIKPAHIGRVLKSLGIETKVIRDEEERKPKRILIMDWEKLAHIFHGFFTSDDVIWTNELLQCYGCNDTYGECQVLPQNVPSDSLLSHSYKKFEALSIYNRNIRNTVTDLVIKILSKKKDKSLSRKELLFEIMSEKFDDHFVTDSAVEIIIDTLISSGRVFEPTPGVVRLV